MDGNEGKEEMKGEGRKKEEKKVAGGKQTFHRIFCFSVTEDTLHMTELLSSV